VLDLPLEVPHPLDEARVRPQRRAHFAAATTRRGIGLYEKRSLQVGSARGVISLRMSEGPRSIRQDALPVRSVLHRRR
jgi:hypothetical protein